jgi:tetratricopeptide (TPR) repeat protein
MRNKVFGLLILLMFSCQQKTKKKPVINISANIEFTDDNGSKISKAELEKHTEIFSYDSVYYKKKDVPDLASLFYEQGKKHQEKADNKKAIEKFKKAHKEAPNWIYPIYNLALLHLLEDDYQNALRYYQLADEIAPKGFYDTKIALHSLQREKRGDLKKGVYKNYLLLEFSGVLTIESSINRSIYELTIGESLKNAQNFAPLWKDYALFLDNTEEKLNAIEKGLAQNPDIKTKGILLINKAIFTNENGYYERATKILVSVIFDPNSTISNVEMAKYILNLMTEK